MMPWPSIRLMFSKVGGCTKNWLEASFGAVSVVSSKVSTAEKSVIGSLPSLLVTSRVASKPMRSSVSSCWISILTLEHSPWNCC